MAPKRINTRQRLMTELMSCQEENDTYLYLRLVNDEDLLRWEAVLKGPNGTPYEGKCAYNKLLGLLQLT